MKKKVSLFTNVVSERTEYFLPARFCAFDLLDRCSNEELEGCAVIVSPYSERALVNPVLFSELVEFIEVLEELLKKSFEL